MKFLFSQFLGTFAVLALAGNGAFAQYVAPSLLPLPEMDPQAFTSPVYPVTSSPYSHSLTRSSYVTVAQIPDVPSEMTLEPIEGPEPTAYDDAMSSSWGDDCASCLPSCCSCWFGSVNGIIMTRDRGNNVLLTRDPLWSNSANMEWLGGGEVRFGRTLYGGTCALEAVYWGIYTDGNGEEANILDANVVGNLETALSLSNLNIGTDPVNSFFDAGQRHMVRRDYEFHNVELNLLSFGAGGRYADCGDSCGPCNPFSMSTAIGIRFMNFDEGFLYAGDEVDTTFGTTPQAEAFYSIDVQNYLIGAQIGGRGDYRWTSCLSSFLDLKMGIYGNHVRQQQRVANGLGQVAVVNNAAFTGQAYQFSESKNDVAFLAEMRFGLDYQLTDRWTLTGGYRALAITGIALAPDQIPHNFSELADAREIKSRGSMILHGAYFGAEYKF